MDFIVKFSDADIKLEYIKGKLCAVEHVAYLCNCSEVCAQIMFENYLDGIHTVSQFMHSWEKVPCALHHKHISDYIFEPKLFPTVPEM